jgi:hypothetical protein
LNFGLQGWNREEVYLAVEQKTGQEFEMRKEGHSNLMPFARVVACISGITRVAFKSLATATRSQI